MFRISKTHLPWEVCPPWIHHVWERIFNDYPPKTMPQGGQPCHKGERLVKKV